MKVLKVIKVKNPHGLISTCGKCKGEGVIPDNSFGSGYSDKRECEECNRTGRTKIIHAEVSMTVPFDYKLT